MSLLDWLDHSPHFPKFYWKSADSQIERAAIGRSACPLSTPLYGGRAFSPSASLEQTPWNSFPYSAFWHPLEERKEELPIQTAPLQSTFSFRESTHHPNQTDWQSLIEEALTKIQNKQLEKVVLARQVKMEGEINPYDLLRGLQDKRRGATLFAVQFSPEACFLGASPECLFRRKGRVLEVDALAGTYPLFKEGLMEDGKERLEFQLVKHSIESALHPLCKDWGWAGEDRIHRTYSLQHLYNQFRGTLMDGVDDQTILDKLHPTAALCGLPKKKAQEFLMRREGFERGWYGGPIGYSTEENAEFYVAIRSALVTPDATYLFSGTGIVEGSIASREWEELNLKIQPLKELLC